MSNYIPRSNCPKKREILAKREEELRHVIKSEASQNKIERYAEKLRAAHLALFKALLHEAVEKGSEDRINVKNVERLKNKSQHWAESSLSDIIDMYRK